MLLALYFTTTDVHSTEFGSEWSFRTQLPVKKGKKIKQKIGNITVNLFPKTSKLFAVSLRPFYLRWVFTDTVTASIHFHRPTAPVGFPTKNSQEIGFMSYWKILCFCTICSIPYYIDVDIRRDNKKKKRGKTNWISHLMLRLEPLICRSLFHFMSSSSTSWFISFSRLFYFPMY